MNRFRYTLGTLGNRQRIPPNGTGGLDIVIVVVPVVGLGKEQGPRGLKLWMLAALALELSGSASERMGIRLRGVLYLGRSVFMAWFGALSMYR